MQQEAHELELWYVESGDLPLVATAIHDGSGLRPEVAEQMALPADSRFREEDPYTGAWTEVAPNRIVARRSRFEVDLNRPRERAVYQVPEDAWGLQVWREGLSPELLQRSLDEYDGFYRLAHRLFSDLEARFGGFVVLDLHSYNHRRGGPTAPPEDPDKNPGINVGTGSLDRSRWGPLVDRFIGDLRRFDFLGARLDVRENVRFRGGHFSQWIHQNFPTSGCALAVEAKKFFMDEWSGRLEPMVHGEVGQALRTVIPGVLDELGRVRRG